MSEKMENFDDNLIDEKLENISNELCLTPPSLNLG
jgi:hypothetical protein